MSRNRGLHFNFILNDLPVSRPPLFVDASLSGGIGGYCGLWYFSLSIEQLRPWLRTCDGWELFPMVDIAWLELLAACTSVYVFTQRETQRIITLYSDNTNVVAWLSKRRAPTPLCAQSWQPSSASSIKTSSRSRRATSQQRRIRQRTIYHEDMSRITYIGTAQGLPLPCPPFAPTCT